MIDKQPLDHIKCKWYIKNAYDYKELQQINSSYYQPCLDDVGSTYLYQLMIVYRICIQIEPQIQGKKYNGITLMKETELIKLDIELEDRLQEFQQAAKTKFDARVQAIFSQDQVFSQLQLPLQVKVHVTATDLQIKASQNGEMVLSVQITEDYPWIQFIRKSFNSIIFHFQENASFKISFNNNFNRDLFGLIIRTCVARRGEAKIMQVQQQKINDKSEVEGKVRVQGDTFIIKVQDCQEIYGKGDKQRPIIQSIDQIIPSEVHSKQNPQDLNCKKQQQIPILSQQTNNKEQKDNQLTATNESPTKNQNNNLCPRPVMKLNQNDKQTHFVLKLDQQSKQIKALKGKYQELSQNYVLQKSAKITTQMELAMIKKQLKKVQAESNQYAAFLIKNKQLQQKNRFYKNQLSILKKELKSQESQCKEYLQIIQSNKKQAIHSYPIKNTKSNTKMQRDREQQTRKDFSRKDYQHLLQEKQELQQKYEKSQADKQYLQNQNCLIKKKISSITSQKTIPSGIEKHIEVNDKNQEIKSSTSIKEQKSFKQSHKIIENLEFKVNNLQKLLSYHKNSSSRSNGTNLNMSFQQQQSQKIINSLTEIITQKQIEIQSLKSINRSLTKKTKN